MIKPNLSVIVPAYNEAQRLAPNLKKIQDFLAKYYPSHELIFVNDGSTDTTAEVIRVGIRNYPTSRLLSYTDNRGKGYATRLGVLDSVGEVVLFMDADMATPLSEIPAILKLLENADIVIGSRGIARDKITKKPSVFRQFSSWFFDQVKYAMVGLRSIKDTQCGFKAFKGDLARQLFRLSKVDRFMFDVEVLYLAQQAGLTIQELPVTWADIPGSHVRFWEGIVNMFKDLWRIRRIHPRKYILKV